MLSQVVTGSLGLCWDKKGGFLTALVSKVGQMKGAIYPMMFCVRGGSGIGPERVYQSKNVKWEEKGYLWGIWYYKKTLIVPHTLGIQKNHARKAAPASRQL